MFPRQNVYDFEIENAFIFRILSVQFLNLSFNKFGDLCIEMRILHPQPFCPFRQRWGPETMLFMSYAVRGCTLKSHTLLRDQFRLWLAI